MLDRRRFLKCLAALGVAAGAPARAQLNEKPRFARNPFTLGVASGYPQPSGVVLWTRLAPVPGAPGGGMPPEVVPVAWQIAGDEGMKKVVASGTAYAQPDWAHSVHVEATGLQPGRPYWYRFRSGEASSAIGRTRTAPAFGARLQQLGFAFVSCQHYEQGYFGAYRHIVADQPDLIVHLGDYIYESSWGRDPVRSHGAPPPVTLDDYRTRYALYRGDADLQSAHAASPWLLTWDDHEVENDYADDRSERLDPPEWFLARRAAAYKAWYEHQPVPRRMVPSGPRARIHTRAQFGQLASFFVLDDRQYRSHEACAPPGRGGSTKADPTQCEALADPARTILGAEQEQWLDASLGASRTRWNVIAQQTRIGQWDEQPGPGRLAWTDSWDGYPAARRRLLDSIVKSGATNPVAIGGDIHAFHVGDLKLDFDNPSSPAIAAEFVGTSITSQSRPQARIDEERKDNPHVLLAEGRYRGYVRVAIDAKGWKSDLRVLDDVRLRNPACTSLASFAVEDGKPGVVKA